MNHDATGGVFDAFAAVAARRADAVALDAGDGHSMSYRELRECAARFAAVLRARGIAPGDRVVVQVEKSPAAVALYLACLQCGTIFVPLNTAYTDAEVAYFLGDAEPALFVHDGSRSDAWPLAAAMARSAGEGLWAEALAAVPDPASVPRRASDIAAICYTSGTTGRSKGAMISHGNLLSNAAALIELWRMTEHDCLLHILPIFHVHGLFVAMHCALLSGAQVRFEPQFDAARTRQRLAGATVMMGVPTHYVRLLAEPGFGRDECRTMRLFISGSAPLRAESHHAFAARTGHAILERYGMTETGMITSNPYNGPRIAGTVGFALPGVVIRARDGDGNEVGVGAVGTLELTGPNVTPGYWRMPDKTTEAFTDDGWFVTGDLVTMEATGRVTIVGRSKDLIIAGGFNIYPKEIEAIIDAMPGVVESAAIGIAHDDFGESIAVFIVTEPGCDVDQHAVMAWVATRLARFKHPRQIEFLAALPRNAMGKVQKAALRNRNTPRAIGNQMLEV